MKDLFIFLIRLFIIVVILGLIFIAGEYIYDALGMFGPILMIGLLIAFLFMAFRE